jgi:excisionase family DNA binding protein
MQQPEGAKMSITVPEAARRTGRNPETIRRWIREGKLRSTKVGTQHILDEDDLLALIGESSERVELPPEWQKTFWGGPMPDVVAAVRRSRAGH